MKGLMNTSVCKPVPWDNSGKLKPVSHLAFVVCFFFPEFFKTEKKRKRKQAKVSIG